VVLVVTFGIVGGTVVTLGDVTGGSVGGGRVGGSVTTIGDIFWDGMLIQNTR